MRTLFSLCANLPQRACSPLVPWTAKNKSPGLIVWLPALSLPAKALMTESAIPAAENLRKNNPHVTNHADVKIFMQATHEPIALPWPETVKRDALQTLQLNIGRYCNLACTHCHVESSPKRTEHMSDETLAKVLEWIDTHRPPVVDITGGAPELNPGFREIVRFARERNLEMSWTAVI